MIDLSQFEGPGKEELSKYRGPELLEEVKRLHNALRLCATMAGIPDPQEACRAVIKTVEEALK